MTGDYLDGPDLDAGYWYASLRSTVQFSRGIERLGATGTACSSRSPRTRC